MSEGWKLAVDNLQSQINSETAQINLLTGQVASEVAQISSLSNEVSALQTEVSAIQQQTAHAVIVVASLSFLNQSASLPVTPIFTPSESALYRVSVYVEFSPAQFGTSNAGVLSWTDIDGQRSTSFGSNTTASGMNSAAFASYVVYDLASSPISFLFSYSVDNLGQTYNLFVVVEQL